jgi:hypothetical protein
MKRISDDDAAFEPVARQLRPAVAQWWVDESYVRGGHYRAGL